MRTDREFEKIFQITGNEHFLAMEGLSKEVPFFVHAYDIKKQDEVYARISDLRKRLWAEKGITTLLIGLFDMVLEYFNREDELEDVFQLERESTKQEFLEEFQSMVNPEHVVIPYFKTETRGRRVSNTHDISDRRSFSVPAYPHHPKPAAVDGYQHALSRFFSRGVRYVEGNRLSSEFVRQVSRAILPGVPAGRLFNKR